MTLLKLKYENYGNNKEQRDSKQILDYVYLIFQGISLIYEK